MRKISFFVLLNLLFIGALPVRANTLFDLEKKQFENEMLKSTLASEIDTVKKKILLNQAAIFEKKQDLLKFLKSNRQLNQFQFGGLMAVENFNVFDRNLKIFDKIQAKNLNSLRELKYYTQDLENEKNDLDLKVKHLNELNQQILIQEQALKTTEKEFLNSLIINNENSLLRLKGKLSEPLSQAKIKKDFGNYYDKQNQFNFFNQGLIYHSNAGQIVQAVGPGKIIFRDAIKYWGESIVVQHAGDYYSVYTNIRNCILQKGDDVTQAEKIGEANGSEFYFELRNKNIAINAKKWIGN